jgi:myosin heavy subunit
LDEECKFPNSSDKTLLDKLNSNFSKNKYYTQPKKSGTTFIIIHYAGEVAYEVSSFLEKNRDTVYDDLIDLAKASGEY